MLPEVFFPPIFKSDFPPLDKEVFWFDTNISKIKAYNVNTQGWEILYLSPSGTITWGTIQGNILDQTDLQEALVNLVIDLLDDRGNFNASGNLFPSSGGSGTAGAILKGDLWTISVAGMLGGHVVTTGDVIRALTDSPGQTDSNWAISENNFGYVAENSANKDISGGYVGLTLRKINFLNVLGTFTSFLTNSNTASRTYTFQNRNGTIADDTDLATKENKITYSVVSSTYAISLSDFTIDCTGTFTVTFPTAVGCSGKMWVIKNSGSGLITAATTSSQTIDGQLTQKIYPGDAMWIQSTGSNLIII